MNLYQPTITGSLAVSGSVIINGPMTVVSGSLSGTASLASTASSADNFLVRNTLTAQTLVVQTITSSIDFVTGSTRFGSTLANTHVFSGSVTMNPGGLFVTSSGRVGIGTSIPSELLELSSATTPRVKITNSTNSGNSGIYFNVKDSGSNELQGGVYYIPGTTTYLTLSGDNVSSHLNVTRAGNVGIGTNNPTNILHASSSLPRVISDTTTRFAVFNLYHQGSEKGAFVLDNQNKLITVEANGDNTYDLRFVAGGSERMRITSSGNVGIGTSSPANPPGFTRFLNISGTDASITISNTNGTAKNWTLGALETGNFIIADGTTERMRITSGGRGLFGTSSPSAGAANFGATSFQVNNEVVSMGSMAGFFWENRSGGVTTSSNWYGWYTTTGTIYLYNGAANAASINPSTGVYSALNPSDIRIKDNVRKYNKGLNELLKLDVKEWEYNGKAGTFVGEKAVGFIANELEQVLPEWVGEFETYLDKEDTEKTKLKNININELQYMMIKSIQELKADNDAIRAELAALKS